MPFMTTPTPLDRAIALAGSKSALAASLGVVKSAVGNWYRNKRVPADQAIKIEAQFGIPAQEMRPDLHRKIAQ